MKGYLIFCGGIVALFAALVLAVGTLVYGHHLSESLFGEVGGAVYTGVFIFVVVTSIAYCAMLDQRDFDDIYGDD